MHAFLWTFSSLLGRRLVVESLDSVVSLCLIFRGTARLFSRKAPLHIPGGRVEFQFLHVLTNTYSLSLYCCTCLGNCKIKVRKRWKKLETSCLQTEVLWPIHQQIFDCPPLARCFVLHVWGCEQNREASVIQTQDQADGLCLELPS